MPDPLFFGRAVPIPKFRFRFSISESVSIPTSISNNADDDNDDDDDETLITRERTNGVDNWQISREYEPGNIFCNFGFEWILQKLRYFSFFAQSVRTKVALPQAARQSNFFKIVKTVLRLHEGLDWGSTTDWIKEKSGHHLARFYPMTSLSLGACSTAELQFGNRWTKLFLDKTKHSSWIFMS